MKGRTIPYSKTELAFLRAHETTPRTELTALFIERFNRPELTYQQINAKCKRMGLRTGRTGRFEKGSIPPNKGQRGVNHQGMKKTQFKKGGVAHNTKPIGYERMCSKNGYIMIKVGRPNPYTGAKSRMMPKHRWIWEEANGPIPTGHVVRFKDGVATHWQLENLVCVSKSVNARLNVKGYNNAPPELRSSILATAQLEDRIGEIEPSAMQRMKARGTFKKHTRAAVPADNLRELIVEVDFDYDVSEFSEEIDRKIALAYPDKSWAVDLTGILPIGVEPSIVHLDWRRAIKRPEIRNRILQFWPDGLPDKVRRVA